MASSTTDTRSIVRGAAAGVVAFVLGYLATYVLTEARVRESLEGVNAILQFFGGEQIPAWQAVGWVFFNAHYVRTQLPGVGGTRTHNFVTSGDLSSLLFAVPIVILLATGFAIAWTRGPTNVRAGTLDGATITIGYAAAAIAGVFLFGVTRGDASISPDPITGVLLAGIVYPLVLGALGGALAGFVVSSERDTGRTATE